MENKNRAETLLETIRQGLDISAVRNTATSLGDRSKYVGLSEIVKYAECPRSAVAAKLGDPVTAMKSLLPMQRGHWFEKGIKDGLTSARLNHFNQLEINASRKNVTIKAHLDFTLVWQQPVKAVRILEVKSCDKLPGEPRDTHRLQAQCQVDLLRHYWNKSVFALRDDTGKSIHENLTFPQMCKNCFDIDISNRPSSISVESWLLYISMKDARAFGPYTHSVEALENILNLATAFQQDLKMVTDDPAHLNGLKYRQGFYPLCSYCESNLDCPKFRQGDYQPQWEPAIQKLDTLKKQQENIKTEISEIESALKQAHSLSETKDWIDTGEHRFRMSTVAGRKSLNQDALKEELCEIFDFLHEDIDVDAIFKRCTKQGTSFPRLTISPVN